MIINTEVIKDEITEHCNRETQKTADNKGLSKSISDMGQRHFQDAKIEIIKKVEEFEKYMDEVDKTFPNLSLIR